MATPYDNTTGRDFYQEGYDAASAGKSDKVPIDVYNCGHEAIDNWRAGYDTAIYDAASEYTLRPGD